MRVIISPHNQTHIPSSPSSDVAVCGECGDPVDSSVPTVTCLVCFTILQRRQAGVS